jgi:CBS domain-containing protein
MPAEISPISDIDKLLQAHRVFGVLDAGHRAEAAMAMSAQRCAAGEQVTNGSALHDKLWLIRSGRVALSQADPALQVLLQAGDCFGAGTGPTDPLEWSATAETEAELLWVDADLVRLWVVQQPRLSVFLTPPAPGRAANGRGGETHLNLMTALVRSLLKRSPVTLPPTASILQTAQTMREQRVSSVLLLEQDHLFGIVTDRDLRNRAVAAGLDPASPVLEIATVAPLTVDVAKPAFEALLLMARHNIHHVPVLDGQRVVGMITATDLTEQHSTSPVYLASEIHKQTTLAGLAAVAAKVRRLQSSLAAADASASSTGQIVTAITDAVTSRLLQLGEAALGPAPVDYAWVAAGSQARSEQTAKSDQDNCLVLDDRYDAALHGAYFKALAGYVNDGLHACGYVYCPGEMMARTDEWRQPQHRWAEYFDSWTNKPEPKALMLTCVFFDQRLIHGRASLLDDLRRSLLKATRDNRIFLSYMVGNALKHRPPLTLFGGIATVRHGELRDAIDLKHSGIVPIVDLARIYALAGGHEAVNTFERLSVAAQSQEISEQGARDLRDALEFLASVRIRHQTAQLARGLPADNFLSLSELSNFERSQLKDAFGVVQTLQSVLAQRYR